MRKYRLFGFINPIDVLIIAGVVALVWGAYLFSMPQQTAARGGQEIFFTIEFPDRPEGFYRNIQPGRAVLDSVRSLHIGYVVEAFGLPAMDDVPDEANNIFRRVPVPGRESTHVVVRAWANVSDYATEIGTYQVRVNQPAFIRSHDFAGVGIISRLEFR